MNIRDGKDMEGEHVKDEFRIGLIYGVVWAGSLTLHKHVLRESYECSTLLMK